MAETINVGVLRALLTADTAQFTMGLRNADSSLKTFESTAKRTTDSIAKGMSEAGKAASASTKLISGMGAAGQQAAAQVNAAMQAQAQKAAEWQQMLQRSAAASDQAVKSFNETSQAGSRAGQALLGVAAVLGTINFGRAAAEAATAASRIQDASERMQIGTEAVQRLGFAAEQSGGSLEAVATAIGRMAETLGAKDADKKLAAIGLSFEQIKGLTPDQTFIAIAEAIRKIPDPLKQSDEATNMFGRSALQLLPAIRAGFKEVGDQAPVMSDAVIKAGDRVGDKLHDIEVRMNNLKAEALLPFADFFTTHLPQSVQIGIAGLSSFIPSLEQMTLAVLAFGGPSGAWKAMVLAFGSISTAAKAAALSFWPLAAAIAAVWAAWKIGNTETVKNTIATWALSSDNLTAKLFRAVAGIDQMTAAQARQAVSATAAAEQAQESAKAVGAVDAAMTKALAPVSSLTGELSAARKALAGLTEEQRQNISAGLAMGQSIEEIATSVGVSEAVVKLYKTSMSEATKATEAGAKAARDAAKDYEAVAKSMQQTQDALTKASFRSRQSILKDEIQAAEKTADLMLKSFNSRVKADEDFTRIARDNEFERAEFAIEMARRQGASWQQLYEMERRLSEAKLQAAIDDAEKEFLARTAFLDRTTAYGEAEYQALKRAHDAAIGGMVEEHQRAEAIKRDELDRTFNVWRRAMDGIRELWYGLSQTLADGLTSALMQAQSFKDAFVGIWQSIKQSLMQIFADILNSFIKTVLDGALGAVMGRKGAFSRALGDFFGGGGGGGQGGGISDQISGGVVDKLKKLFGFGGGGAAGGATAGGFLASSSVPIASSMWGPAAIGSQGVSAGVGAGAGGAGAAGGGGIGSTMMGLATNPITWAVAGGVLLTWAIKEKGLFRGGEEAIKVNPARDDYFKGFQEQYGGGQFEALAKAFAEKGIDGGIAESLIKKLYAADTMKDFEAATKAINDTLGETATSMQSANAAFGQFVAASDKLDESGQVSRHAIFGLQGAMAELSKVGTAAQIQAFTAELAQMMATGTATEASVSALTTRIFEMADGARAAADATAAGVSKTTAAVNQFNATVEQLQAVGAVSEEAINALRAQIQDLSATASPDIIEQLNATLAQMIAAGSVSDKTIEALTATVAAMSQQTKDTTTTTDDLTGASTDLEKQFDRNCWMTLEMRNRLAELEQISGSAEEAWRRLSEEMAQPIDIEINVPTINLGDYMSGPTGEIPSFANEGIVRSPMLAMVGDAKEPEWILHQSSVMDMARRAFSLGAFAGNQADGLDGSVPRSSSAGRDGGVQIGSLSVTVNSASGNAQTLARELLAAIPQAMRMDHNLVRQIRGAVA